MRRRGGPTKTHYGPCTPTVSVNSMSAERLGPEMNTSWDGGRSGKCSGMRRQTSDAERTTRLAGTSARWTGGSSDTERPPARPAATATLPVAARPNSAPVMPRSAPARVRRRPAVEHLDAERAEVGSQALDLRIRRQHHLPDPLGGHHLGHDRLQRGGPRHPADGPGVGGGLLGEDVESRLVQPPGGRRRE